MKTLNPYINFAGKCREALAFYQDCFGGEILALQTFAEAPEEVPGASKDNVMHAEFKAESIFFMATDGMGSGVVEGSNISLSLNFTDETEQETIFMALSQGGNVTMPLAEMFWGAKFGSLTDRYGINWMLNCPKSSA